jgi:peptidoglycan/xylan/chitin deacetylase (PgdA/CDA1 family)
MNGLICILTFHGLGSPERPLPDGEERYWLAPSFFEGILDRVRHRPDVLITFDDSNSSDITIALPALVKRQMRAVFFIVSERMGLPGFLSVEQVQELAQAGMAVGSHGTKHRPWTQLGGEELDEELRVSRRRLEQVVDKTVGEAACPFGSYNRRVLNRLRAAGYHKVYTSDQGLARQDDWVAARNTIMRNYSLQQVESMIQPRPRGVPAFLRMLKRTVKRLK